MELQETIDTYGAAWGEPDPDRRRQLLEQAWAEDGTYTDPMSAVTGRDELAEHIAGFQAQMAGHRIENASQADEHHGWFRFAWRMLGPDGAVAMEGFDVGERAEDGRIRRIVGFFGPFAGQA
jgi:hypothetical protein